MAQPLHRERRRKLVAEAAMFKKVLGLVAVAGFTAACVEAAVSSEEIESLTQELSCSTVVGLMPAKASLAVAMASELGAWKPLVYLEVDPNQNCWTNGHRPVKLTEAGLDKCGTAGCPVTKALLTLQDPALNSSEGWDQDAFNSVNFCHDLRESFQRQQHLLNHIQSNHPTHMPPTNYSLSSTGSVDLGGCGPHFGFNPSGAPVPSDLQYDLCFFGHDAPAPVGFGCGGNGWIDFRQDSGRVLIDPNDTGDLDTTVRVDATQCLQLGNPPIVNDPANDYIGRCCNYYVNSVKQTGRVADWAFSTTYNYCKKTS